MQVKSRLKHCLKIVYLSMIGGAVRRYVHYCNKGHLIRAFKIKKFSYYNEDRKKFLQVGGGKHSIKDDGWINGDIIDGDIYLDATKKLPFPDHYFDGIFTEQFIEHIPLEGMRKFSEECYRVLKPGGVIRHTTPNLPLLFDVYKDRNTKVAQSDAIARLVQLHTKKKVPITPAEFLNAYFRWWGHQFIYDFETLALVCDEVGFIGIKEEKFHESRIANMSGKERHFDSDWMKDGYQLTIEAEKKDE